MESIADFLARTARERQERDVAAAGVVISTTDKNPDQVAGDLSLAQDWAKETGRPVPPMPLVEEYRPVFQQQIEAKRNTTILSSSPKLAEWLRDPQNAALARDDLTGLSYWERVSKSFKMGEATAITQGQEFTRDIGTVLERGALGQGLDALGETFDRTLLTNEDGTPNLFGRLANFARSRGMAADGVPRQMVGGPDVTPDERADAMAGMDFGPLYDGAAALLSEMEKQQFAPMSYKDVDGLGAGLQFISENLSMSLPQMAAAMTSGAFSPFLQVITLGGEANAELKERTDLPEDQRVAIASGAGVVMAGLDYFGLSRIFGGIPAGKVVTEAVEGTLVDRLIKNGVSEAVGRTFQAALAEGTTEALQEAIVVGVTALSGGEYTREEVIERLAQGFFAGAGAGGAMRGGVEAVIGGGAAARRMTEGDEKARAAAENQERIAEIAQQSAQSKLRARMPDVFRAWVERATENGPAESLYVPADKFTEYFQSIGMDPYALADEMDGVSRSDLETALATGGDLRIPTATYAARLAGSEADQFFMENMRFDPDEFTSAEARAFEDTKAELMAEALNEAERIFAEQQELRTYEQEIFDTMVERLRIAGRATDVATTEAALYPAFYKVMAERAGIPLGEFIQRYPLPQVRGDIPQGMQAKNVDELTRTLATARVARQAGVNQPKTPLLEFISNWGGISDMGGELAARDAAVIRRGRGRSNLRLQRDPALPTRDSALRGYGPDDVAQAAIEAGLMADNPVVMEYKAAIERGDQVPDITRALWDEIDRELRGEASTRAEDMNAGPSQDDQIAELERYLGEIGVSLDDDDAVIRQAIEADQAERGRMYGQTATVRRGTETLKKFGLDPTKRYTTREVASALEARQRKKYGTIERGDYSDEASKRIAGWMVEETLFEVEQAEVNPMRSAVGWYSTKYQSALDAFGAAFPEFLGEMDTSLPGVALLGNRQNARDFFTALMAITSDGAKVADNFRFATQAYEFFRQNGRIDTEVTFGGERNKSMRVNLANIQKALDQHGPENMTALLLEKDTISNLKKKAKALGQDFSSDYKASMQLPYAAVVFGPKLGAFYANLMGDTGYLTMDRWWSRTFNRYRGTLLQQPTEAGLARFKELVTADQRRNTPASEMTDDEAIALTVDYVRSYKAKGYKNGTEIEKAANTLYKAAFEGLEDQPFNASDREFMINTTVRAQKMLKRRGIDLTIADIQAVLWYYEKRLYGELGARQTQDISYEEIARNVVAGRDTPVGPDDEVAGEPGDAGYLDRGTAADLEAQGPALDAVDDQFNAGVGRTYGQGAIDGRPEQAGDGGGRYSSGSLAPLEGAPRVAGAAGPDLNLVAVAEDYARSIGIELRRQAEFVEVDPERAARIAEAYEAMPHAPQDPVVREAYENLIGQTVAQYRALEAAGYEFFFFDDNNDPYEGNPWNAMRDLRANKRMGVYATEAGFGSGATELDVSDNPMLADTGIRWMYDGQEKRVLANDLFRAVHDAFGHGLEGAGFRARGEENAWQAHVRLFTGSAVAAITSETRGQNSWLNYGPYGEQNRNAAVEDTVFADQKTGLMPEWTWTEGRAADEQPVGRTYGQAAPEIAQPLYVVHNLSADKLRFASDLGGLAAPSIAIARGDIGFDSFGEISLIGDPSMADPKAKGVRAFNADVYSPRQPRARFKVNAKTLKAVNAEIGKVEGLLGYQSEIDADDIARSGMGALEGQMALKAAWLRSQGEDIPIVREALDEPMPVAGFTGFTSTDPRALSADPAFVARVRRKYDLQIKKNEGNDALIERIKGAWLDEDGEVSADMIVRWASDVARANRAIEDFRAAPQAEGKVSRYLTGVKIDEAIAGREDQFNTWLRENFGDVISDAYFEDERGRRREYTLTNLVREMTRSVRNGENWNYGAGNVRAAVAPEFRTLSEIKAARGQITDEKAMEALKDEVNTELFALADKFAPYAGTEGQRFGWGDTFSEFLRDVAKGPRAVAEWPWSVRVPDELMAEAVAFLEKLKGLPTNYFEIKMQRAVSLGEFKVALVPEKASAETVKTLTDAGVEVLRYGVEGRQAALQRVAERVFFQEQRGSIAFPSAGVGNGDTVVSLFRRADLSTFLHESGHYFLTVMQDMAQKGEASAIAEFDTLKAWWRSNAAAVAKDAMRVLPDVKVTEADVIAALDNGTTGDIMKDAAIDVGMQEQFARSFEAYLMEGKAPSVELRTAFEKFRAWLVSVYRSLRGLNVEIDDNIRAVFDRMLATDQEIAEARTQTGDRGPMFTEAPAGMSPEDWARYQAIGQAAQDEAASRLLAETMAPIRREAEAAYRAEKDAVRAEVEPVVNARREYRAIEWMGNRRWLGADQPQGLPDMRLDRQTLVDRYGEGVLKTLPRGKFTLYANEGGVDPEIAAGLFGFGSADEMIRALERAPKRAEAITAEVEKIMFERHGDPLRDGTVEARAIEAVHGDKRARMLAIELDVLRAAPGGTKSAVSVFREMARGTLAQMRVRDAMAANRYLAAERKAGEASYRAAANGDMPAAAEAKRRQLLNHMLYTEARKIEAEVEAAEKLAARLQKKSTRDKLAGDYLEAIDEILGRYDFRRISGKAEDRRGALAAYVERMKAEGRENELAIPERVLQDAQRVPYKRLTVEHLRGVVDSLKNIEHTARLKQKLIDAQSQRDLDAVVDDILGAFDDNVKPQPPGRVGTTGERFRAGTRAFLDLVLNAGTLLREIDGFKDLGPAFSNLKAPIDAAQNRLQARREKAAMDLDALYQVYTKKERRQMAVRQFVPEIGASLSKWERIAVALNMGNEGNYQRLTDTKVRGGFTEAQVKAIVAGLDERDARFVQSVWDYLETFRGDIEAREKRVTGVAPKWVESRPVQIAGIDLRGGYYPLKYDPRLSSMARDDAAQDIAKSLQAGRFGKAQTRNGHLKERATSSGRPVELDISVLHRHVQQVVYDLELSEPVANSWRILQDGRIRDAFVNAGKQADFDALEIWLKDVAEGELRAGDVAGQMARRFKSNFTAAKLAFNLSTVAVQITGVAQSMVVVGKADFLKGVQMALRPGVRDEVHAKSQFMRDRSTTFNKDIFDLYNDPRLGPVASRWTEIRNDWIAPAGFYLMTKVQSYLVDVPTWLAGYNQGLRKFGGDEAKAVAYADDIVKRSQASGIFSDRSAVERGSASMRTRQNEFLRLFTTLGSYMFAKFNVAYERTGRARQVIEREGLSLRSAQEAVSWTIDVAFLFTLEAVLYAAIKGRLPDEEDDEDDDGMTDEWAAYLAKETALSFMSTMPFVRDIGSVLTGFGGGGAYGAITEELAKPLIQAGQGEVDAALVKSVISATGLFTGLPAGQINRAVDAGWRQAEGEDVSPAEYLLGKIGK